MRKTRSIKEKGKNKQIEQTSLLLKKKNVEKDVTKKNPSPKRFEMLANP